MPNHFFIFWHTVCICKYRANLFFFSRGDIPLTRGVRKWLDWVVHPLYRGGRKGLDGVEHPTQEYPTIWGDSFPSIPYDPYTPSHGGFHDAFGSA